MKITFARTLKELEELAEPWQRLEASVQHVLPFQSFAWTCAWWQTFEVRNFYRQDRLMVTAYWEEDLLVGVVPRVISQYRVLGVPIYHYVRPIGADPNLTEIRVPLILPYFQQEVIELWLSTVENFRDPRGLHKIIVPADAVDEGETASSGHSMMDTMMNVTRANRKLALLDTRRVSNFVLELAASKEEFRKGLKRNIKESLRRCYNSLTKDGLSAELVVWSSSDDILRHLDAFCAMHGERANLKDTVVHPDYFASPQHRAFLTRLAQDADRSGMLLFALKVGGQFVAMRVGFVVNTELYLYYSGYRLDHAKYSVMTTLVNEMIGWAHEQGLKRVNLSIGNDVSKTRWGPQEVVYAEQHFVRDTVMARAVGRWMLRLKGYRQAA